VFGFLPPTLQSALILAYFVVGVELLVIAFIRSRYFSMSLPLSVVQVVIGGLLVFASGVLTSHSAQKTPKRSPARVDAARRDLVMRPCGVVPHSDPDRQAVSSGG
jgi:hypothetical protein